MKRKENDLMICLATALILLSQMRIIHPIALYFGLLIYVADGWFFAIRGDRIKKRDVMIISLLFFGMSIGVIIADIDTLKKAVLLSSYFITISIYHLWGKRDKDHRIFMMIGNTVLCCYLIALIWSMFHDAHFFRETTNGEDGYGLAFVVGNWHKNTLGICLFAGEISLILYSAIEHRLKKENGWKILLYIFLIIIAKNRTGMVLNAVVFAIVGSYIVGQRIVKKQRKGFYRIAFLLGIIVAIVGILWLSRYSFNFSIRLKTLYIYIELYGDKMFEMLFGQSGTIYASDRGYFDSWRALTGSEGTFEIGYLNILVKNGLVGLITYCFMMFYPLMSAMKAKDGRKIYLLMLVIVPLFFSGIIELFIQNIKVYYSVFCWSAISMIHNNADPKTVC